MLWTYVRLAVMNLKFVNVTVGRELDVSGVEKRERGREREGKTEREKRN